MRDRDRPAPWRDDAVARRYAAELSGNEGLIIAIGIEAPAAELPSNVKFPHGNSIAPEIAAEVRELCAGGKTMS